MRTTVKPGHGDKHSFDGCTKIFLSGVLKPILGALGIALCLTCEVPVCSQNVDKTLSQYSARLYTTEQGLPQNEVRSIAQTPDGYLWFGTRDGLARFDGVRFSIFRQEITPGIGHNMFGAMLVDHLGRLWIATGDGLSRYENGRFERYTERDGLPANAVHTLLEDHSGKLWIGTWNGLAVFDGTHFRTLTKGDGLPANAIAGLAEDGNGGLWIGTYGGGVAHMVNGHFKVSTEKDGLPADFIQTIFRDHAGRLWVGTLKGTALLTSNGRFETVPSLPGKSICFYEDRDGTLWAATDKTFARLTPSGSVFERQEGPNQAVETLFEDRDGGLWVGTSGAGVGRYRSGSFAPFTTHEGLADNTTESVFEDSRRGLWIGTVNGLSYRTSQGFHTFSAGDLGDGVIRSIAEDGSGRVWAATSKGVAIFDGHSWKRMGPRENVPVDIHVLYKDRQGRMWMGSPEGITIWDQGRLTKITQKDGLPGNYVMSILEDRLNNMWIGTITGLARLEHGKITTYTTKDGLLSNYIQCLSEDSDGILWICTPSGLHRLKSGQFHGFTVKEGMFADSALRLLEDDSRRFWISSYRGIFRVNRDDLNRLADGSLKRIESASYGTDDGLKSTSCGGLGMQPAGWKARDGKLWFPTDKGVVSVDPSNLSAPVEAPTPILEAVQKDGVPTTDTEVGPETRRIAFLFTAPTSVKPEAIEYRYRMQGYEDNWHKVETEREISFTNLRPGVYRFFVSARRAGGKWSADQATLPFHVLPHFYETPWFYLASGLLLVLLIGLAHSLRVRETERRLTTIMAERSRVAQELHDTLLQSVAGTAMEIQGALRLLNHGSTETGFRQLSTALDHLGKSMGDARQAIWDLRSPESCDLPLDQALESAARRVCERGPRLSWIVLGTPEALAQSFKRQVYGIGMEAITNAARHSGCSEISIQLEYRHDSIELLVRDDGCGFDCALAESAYLSNHWGLAGMKERAKQCSGKIAIESRPGTGTVVRFEAPLGMAT